MASGSLDSNVLLRLLLDDVPEHHQAAYELISGASAQFAVADTAIIETVFVLHEHYNFTREQIVTTINGLVALQEINCNRALFEMALPLFAAHPKLSFEDCCLAAYATLNNAEPLWTFDKKLATQTASARLVVS